MDRCRLTAQSVIRSNPPCGLTELFLITAQWIGVFSWCSQSSDQTLLVDALNYFLLQLSGSVSTHGAVSHQIKPSLWTHRTISYYSSVDRCRLTVQSVIRSNPPCGLTELFLITAQWIGVFSRCSQSSDQTLLVDSLS